MSLLSSQKGNYRYASKRECDRVSLRTDEQQGDEEDVGDFSSMFIASTAGYVAKLVAAFVKSAPSAMFAYLQTHVDFIISNIVKNMMHCGTLDIIRFLLDVPLESSSFYPIVPYL